MAKEKIKVYTYTRVSTAMQIDGYSLDAQKSRMKAFAEFNDYEIAHEYEDAGKSGKSIEGRTQFNQMMEDIKTGKDGVSFVLVFKLSRFGRNAADVLSTLQVMQDFGVNLICVEDGIDSSKDAGKLMISVLSAVAEIERENIRVQTMEGRIQKAREGKWNGGFAPYGYKLVDGRLEINEEEAPAIRTIYEQYVTTDSGANGIAKYLEKHGISKVQRQNGKNPLFDARLIRMILKNPVYCGKIAYGRRKTEKVHGTRNEYRLVEQENFLLVDGLHEAIVPEDVWQAAQIKLAAQAKRYEHVNKGKYECTHLLSGIVKCPVCGVGMYGNKCVKRKADGSKYKDFYYYGCKHRSMTRGHKCDYKKQIRKELLDDAVAEVICKLVSNPRFAAMMQEKINMKVDTTAIEQEISNYEKQLRQAYSTKSKLIEEIDSLDPDDRHYSRRKSDLDDRLYGMYDKIEELESLLIAARAKKQAIEAEKLTGDNIYKVLIYFDQLYGKMNDREKRQLIEELISEIQIYPDRQPNGQWLKSIKFRLPIIEEDMNISLDNEQQVEQIEHEHTIDEAEAHELVKYWTENGTLDKWMSDPEMRAAEKKVSEQLEKGEIQSPPNPATELMRQIKMGATPEQAATAIVGITSRVTETVEKEISYEDAQELMLHFEQKGYITSSGKMKDTMKNALKTGTLDLPKKYEAARERFEAIIANADRKPPVRDASRDVVVRINKQVMLSPEFIELWNKIKQKTAYRVSIDTDKLVENCVKDFRDMPVIPKARLISQTADIHIDNTGIYHTEREMRTMDVADSYSMLPDLITAISDETLLTPATVNRILVESGRCMDFLNNPEAFLEKAMEIIRNNRHALAIDGISYVKLDDKEYYVQEIFDTSELIANLDRNAVKVEHSVYDCIVYDSSSIERPFAVALDNDPDVKMFFKIPERFKIETPIGTYNPDWAVFLTKNGEEKLYFILETKGSTSFMDLRTREQLKIHCGRKHFEALNNGIEMQVATNWNEIKTRV